MVTVLSIDLIVSDPNLRHGRLIIGGTGIRVQDIVAYYLFDRQTPEELAAGFRLSMAQVHAALTYYFLHKEEIDSYFRQDSTEAKQLLEEMRRQGKVIDVD